MPVAAYDTNPTTAAELQTAITNAIDGTVIELGGSFSITDEIVLNEAKTVTIDGKGHTISRDSAYLGNLINITQGTLILTDSGPGFIIQGQTNTGVKVESTNSLILIKSNAHLIMNDGVTLRNNTHTSDVGGGAIYMESNSELRINGGMIVNNSVPKFGGGIRNQGGTIYMTGGVISNNTADGNVGGIENQGIMYMSGGEVSYNTAGNSAGGINNNPGTLYLSGNAVISNNTAKGGHSGGIFSGSTSYLSISENVKISHNKVEGSHSGGVRNEGLMYMSGGEVSYNVAKSSAGGVSNEKGTLYLSGYAIISSNMATNNRGGGIYNSGLLVMSGNVEVSDNTAREKGGGISHQYGVFKINETVKIVNNLEGTALSQVPSDVYLYTGKKIVVTSPLKRGAVIGVRSQSTDDTIKITGLDGGDDGDSEADAGYFFADDAAYHIIYDVGDVYMTKGGGTSLPTRYIWWKNGVEWIDTATQTFTTESATPIKPISDPSIHGYTFSGWSTNPHATASDAITAGFPDVTSNTVYYAIYGGNPYTITFETNGGSTVVPIEQGYGTTIIAPAEPTKTGYTFNRWEPKLPSTMPIGGATVTAQWTVNQYTLTFIDTGDAAIPAITNAYGATIPTIADPTKTGYSFDGWDKTIPTTMPLGGDTITAQWTINQYTIWFNDTDGSIIDKITADFGTPITAPTLTKEGYTLQWQKEDDSVYTVPATMPAEDIHLKVVWKAIPQEPYSSTSSQGSSVWLMETQTPTPTPTETVAPTPTDAVPTDIPDVKPTQTPDSPAPILGILAGLGVAVAVLRRR